MDTLPEHIRTPHVRPIQPIPVKKDGQQFIALRDPAALTQGTMVVGVPAFQVIQRFQGNATIDDLAQQHGAKVEQFATLAQKLDEMGLLWGPTFEQLETDARERLVSAGAFAINASQSLGEDVDACRARIDDYFAQTEDPELEGAVSGIVAPHLDYERGWPNYAAAYYCIKDAPAPDRVVILGTNHFGVGDGIVMSEHGFQSPMGTCPADQRIVGALVERFGRPLIIDELDLLPEHSIELHLPWIQYLYGDIPLVAALVPDPLAGMIEEDDARVDTDAFITGLRETLDDAGGETIFIASSDLSHVGPQFGEPRPVDEQRRFDVERHDREMMAKFIDGDAEEFLSAFQWNKNPTRWCSVGNMHATLQLAQPESIELIDYRQAFDEQGRVMVTSAALALMAGT